MTGFGSVEELAQAVACGAMCRGQDTEDFYPVERLLAEEIARRACFGCPVQLQCLELSLQIPAGRHGIWGGHSEDERAVMLRRRREAARKTALAAERAAAASPEPPAEMTGAVA
jgi:WhiB family redox-sensing transcriptional regulator